MLLGKIVKYDPQTKGKLNNSNPLAKMKKKIKQSRERLKRNNMLTVVILTGLLFS